MKSVLEMAGTGKIKPLVTVREFEELDDILQELGKYEVEGRIVVKIPQ